jgi:hypothetical protein
LPLLGACHREKLGADQLINGLAIHPLTRIVIIVYCYRTFYSLMTCIGMARTVVRNRADADVAISRVRIDSADASRTGGVVIANPSEGQIYGRFTSHFATL